MGIEIAEQLSITVPGTTRVVVEDYLVFISDGQVVGRLNAEFDFGSLPAYLHGFAAQHLMMRRSSFAMPLAPLPTPTPPSTPAAALASKYYKAGIINRLRSLFTRS